MKYGRQPTYDLAEIQERFRSSDEFFIRGIALDGAFLMGFDRYDIVACVLALDEHSFHKTMPSERIAGLMQDVYKCEYMGQRIYLKLQLDASGMPVVIQFKEE